jgi:hypothetical protein
MGDPPAGIAEADWLSWLCGASLRERIGRSTRNSSKPPPSDGPAFMPPEQKKGSGRKRAGQPVQPGSGAELLLIERVELVLNAPAIWKPGPLAQPSPQE